MTLLIHPEAEAEILAAAEWYEDKSQGLGLEWLVAVDHGMDRILRAPTGFPLWRVELPYRKCVLSRFPYMIFFTASGDVVNVLAVAHVKRRPGFWTERKPR